MQSTNSCVTVIVNDVIFNNIILKSSVNDI